MSAASFIPARGAAKVDPHVGDAIRVTLSFVAQESSFDPTAEAELLLDATLFSAPKHVYCVVR
jgi:hypothetical protein